MKVGEPIVTDGIPIYSAAIEEPHSFTVQSPQAQLPEIIASTLLSFSAF